MTRAALCVPGSEPQKIAKAAALEVDQIVVDLEDAVALSAKESARENVSRLQQRASGTVSVRVNALGTPWVRDDIMACVANDAVSSIVVPKVESATDLTQVADLLDDAERAGARTEPLTIQALIESAAGLTNVTAIACATHRLRAMIIGYADLSASLGRRLETSWQFAQDAVLLAARTHGVLAIDGPHLSTDHGADFQRIVDAAAALGFDGKWVIHPRQVQAVQEAFTPSPDDIEEAHSILSALDGAAREGVGAVQWRGRMLDEAIAMQARRVLARVDRAQSM